jgi:hypothetical protein
VSTINNLNSKTSYIPTKASTAQDATAANSKEIHISRELDGVEDSGVLGDMLTAGTSTIADANKYFALKKYAVSGLLSENNQAVGAQATVAADAASAANSNIECEDDLYLAGDPTVGGKGNNYQGVQVDAAPGYYTMFQDGSSTGPQITVNGHLDTINPQGNKAYTEYGFLVKDSAGQQTQATLSGGQLTIAGPDGSTQKLLPPNGSYVVGDPADPDAKFYYADVPGAGKDGASEKRLMVDYYEKPTDASVKEMVAQGMSEADAKKLRSTTTLSYGFRVPDGVDTYASPEGVGAGNAMKTASNGVKTYYDSHYTEGNCQTVSVCDTPPPPPPPPVAVNEHARLWGDPHVNDADGGAYLFPQAGIYNVLQDKGLTVNAQTNKMASDPSATVMSEAGATVGSRTVHVTADGTTTVGYADPANSSTTILQDGQTMALDDGSSITKTGNNISLTTPEYNLQFSTMQQYNGSNFLDIDAWSKGQGVQADGVAPSGLLGETFDADNIPQTAPKLDSSAYSRSSLIERTATTTSPTPTPAAVVATSTTTPTPATVAAATSTTTPTPATVSTTPTTAADTVATPSPVKPPVTTNATLTKQNQKLLNQALAQVIAQKPRMSASNRSALTAQLTAILVGSGATDDKKKAMRKLIKNYL